MSEMKHLHLFPTEFPKDQAMIVINGLRGVDDGKSKRDRVEAAWWVIGAGLSMIPDDHPAMHSGAAMTNSEAADHLEAMTRGGDSEGMKAIPWSLLLPILMTLLQKWLS